MLDLPPCASCPVNTNVNDEEFLPLVSVPKGSTFVFEELTSQPRFSNYVRYESTDCPFTSEISQQIVRLRQKLVNRLSVYVRNKLMPTLYSL